MAYEVTATRKRPQTFDSLAGQEFVVSTLKSAVAAGRIAHAYLFSGPRGVGKTSAARILAKALNCQEGPTAIPCGTCPNCTEITRGNSMDVIEIDGASNTSVNDVREIKDEVLFAPNSARYKVYIIDEVHMLSNSAFNALLKTIEEPPPYIVFVFATTEIHKVPPTIRSRCQQFNFRLIPIDDISGLLREACDEIGVQAEDDALFWIAKEATGSLRDAYTLLDQVVSFSDGGITQEIIREKLGLVGLDRINELADRLADGDAAAALRLVDDVLAAGVSVEQFVFDLAEYFRNLLFLKHDIRKESILGYSLDRFSSKATETFSVTQIEQSVALLLELYRNIRFSLNQRFELELVLSRLASISRYLTPSEILRRIEGLKRELREGGSAGVAPSTGRVSPDAADDGGSDTTVPEQSDDEYSGEYADDVGYDETSPRPAGSGDTEYADSAGSGDDSGKEEILKVVRSFKLALSTALEKAVRWHDDGTVLSLAFENAYPANVVKTEARELQRIIREVTGRSLQVKVRVESGSQGGEPLDDQVEMVRRVFRGEIIPDREGEST